jgi:DNA-binding IclR family transcriptional regulator
MSVAAIRRSFQVVHHLKTHGEARFTDLVQLLSPISRTALSHLLESLIEIGEIEHAGRRYRLAVTGGALAGNDRSIYSLPPALRAQTHAIIERAAMESMHSCALFARVGMSTMKIMDAHNLPDPHWPFTPVGYEWPLVPFHGFARLFLAYSSDTVARDCYLRWHPYLQPSLRPPTYKAFRAELEKIRRQGYAVEYKAELSTILRIVVPVRLAEDTELRFALGMVANFVYLLEAKRCLAALRSAAQELAGVLQGKVPLFRFEEKMPSEGEPAWAARPPVEV